VPSRETSSQKGTVGRVMHEFKHGELESGRGGKVKSRKQAVAIALREAGASNRQSPAESKKAQRQTKAKERQGRTAEAAKEGKAAQKRTERKYAARGKRPSRATR
jgi:Family of unknown function (DUF6496)